MRLLPTENHLYTGISQLVTMPYQARNRTPLCCTPKAFLWLRHGHVEAFGEHGTSLPAAAPPATDLGGRAVIPGLVDSHTHTVFAGARLDDFARRARGEMYAEIAQAGGGIARSVADLHAASNTAVLDASLARLQQMLARGTTTVEIKSGYGLNCAAERRHLQLIQQVGAQAQQSILPTVLLHGVPKGVARPAYLNAFATFVEEVAQQGLACYLDVFCEPGIVTADETRTLAATARSVGLGIKLHVDQLCDGNGAALAAELQAVSADHLECTPAANAPLLAQAGVVATLLPGCGLFLGQGPWPDGAALRRAGVEVAVATDCNPGSSMVVDLLLCATLAVTRCGLTLEEGLWAVTRGGAKALGLKDRGGLGLGERADCVVLDHDDWRAALYYPGHVPIYATALGHTTL